MKILIALVISIVGINPSIAIETLDIALEATSLKLEYYESTQRGIVRLQGCSVCDKDFYDFDSIPNINKNGNTVSFEYFQKDFWNAKYPTVFLDKTTQQIIRIQY